MRAVTWVALAGLLLLVQGCTGDETVSSEDVTTVEDSGGANDLAQDATPEDTHEDTGRSDVTEPPVDTVEPPADTVSPPADTTVTDTSPPTDTAPADDLADTTPADTSSADTTVADAVPDAPADTGPEPDCPLAVPTQGASCARPDLVCQFGTDPRLDCRVRATCTAGAWAIDDPQCADPPTTTCPATRADAAGQTCDTADAWCVYDGLACACNNCLDGPVAGCFGDPWWHCDAPHADPSCPETWPNLGVACGGEGLVCQYHCGQEGARRCEGGVWVMADGGPCPISTRRAKTDIAYLEDGEIRAAARGLLSMRLARWRYADPALAGPEHMGFIIEDTPIGSPAVASDRQMVDLYGYASMLVAATQVQQRSIERLQAEVDALRREVEHLRAKPDRCE